jgi:hypothetical protein
MEKFLSAPVLDAGGANAQRQNFSIMGIHSISQFSTTRVDITYMGGKQIRLTWPGGSATAAPGLLVEVQDKIAEALTKGWTNVVMDYDPKGVTPAAAPVNFTNPLASIAVA